MSAALLLLSLAALACIPTGVGFHTRHKAHQAYVERERINGRTVRRG